MSQYLDSLKIGDTVDIRGPAGKLTYLGRGEFEFEQDSALLLLEHLIARNSWHMGIEGNNNNIVKQILITSI